METKRWNRHRQSKHRDGHQIKVLVTRVNGSLTQSVYRGKGNLWELTRFETGSHQGCASWILELVDIGLVCERARALSHARARTLERE